MNDVVIVDKSDLKNGTKINVPEGSAEAKLIAAMEDPNYQISKEHWITLDKVYFETGSDKIKESSKEQLNNIVAILKGDLLTINYITLVKIICPM